MIRSAIRTLARKRLGETTGAFWTDEELNGWINLGVKDLARRAKCVKGSTYLSATTVAENTVGTVSNSWTISSELSGCLSIDKAYFHQNGQNWVPLISKTKDDLDVEIPGWMDSIGRTYSSGGVTYYNYGCSPSVPEYYYWDIEEDVIGIYPACDSNNDGTNNLKIEYRKFPTDMSLDSETPGIPEPLHEAIVFYVVATGAGTRGWGDKENDFWSKYFSSISDYITERKREREDDEVVMKSIYNLR